MGMKDILKSGFAIRHPQVVAFTGQVTALYRQGNLLRKRCQSRSFGSTQISQRFGVPLWNDQRVTCIEWPNRQKRQAQLIFSDHARLGLPRHDLAKDALAHTATGALIPLCGS